MGKHIKLDNVRVSWPNILAPKKSKKFPNNPPTYSMVLVLDPQVNAAQINELKTSFEEAGATFQGQEYSLPPSWKTEPDGKIYLRVTCAEDRKPQVVDEHVNPVFDPNKIYAGCYCNVVVDIYASSTYGNKVSCGLVMVQFAADGDRFDGTPDANEIFKPIPVTGSPAAAAPAAPAPGADPLG